MFPALIAAKRNRFVSCLMLPLSSSTWCGLPRPRFRLRLRRLLPQSPRRQAEKSHENNKPGKFTKDNEEEGVNRLVAGSGRAHVAPRIDRRVVHANFIMDVRTRGAAADARISKNFTALDAPARNGRKGRKVRVPSG